MFKTIEELVERRFRDLLFVEDRLRRCVDRRRRPAGCGDSFRWWWWMRSGFGGAGGGGRS